MEKRSRRRVPELVTRLAFQGLSENEIGRARISMMARNANVPFKGRIQKRKTNHLQIITFDLQRTAGPYKCAMNGLMRCNKVEAVSKFFVRHAAHQAASSPPSDHACRNLR